jgi:hypothetical protein
MNPAGDEKDFKVEYPDEAGYPDGEGFLDEGTAGKDAVNDDDDDDEDDDDVDDDDDEDIDDIDDDVTDFEQELDGPDEDQVTGSA